MKAPNSSKERVRAAAVITRVSRNPRQFIVSSLRLEGAAFSRRRTVRSEVPCQPEASPVGASGWRREGATSFETHSDAPPAGEARLLSPDHALNQIVHALQFGRGLGIR